MSSHPRVPRARRLLLRAVGVGTSMTLMACGDVAQGPATGKEAVEAGPTGTACEDGCGLMGTAPSFQDAGLSAAEAGLPHGSLAVDAGISTAEAGFPQGTVLEDAGTAETGTITVGSAVDAGFIGDTVGDAG